MEWAIPKSSACWSSDKAGDASPFSGKYMELLCYEKLKRTIDWLLRKKRSDSALINFLKMDNMLHSDFAQKISPTHSQIHGNFGPFQLLKYSVLTIGMNKWSTNNDVLYKSLASVIEKISNVEYLREELSRRVLIPFLHEVECIADLLIQ